MLKVAVLVSGGGTNLQAILDAIDNGTITNAEVSVVISNNRDAYALERARKHNIEAVCVSPKDYPDRAAGFLCGRSCGACRIPRCDPGNDDKKIRKPDHKYPSILDPVFLWNGLLWIEGTRGRAFAWCKNNRSHRAFCG